MPKHELYVLDGESAFCAIGICAGILKCGDCRRCPYFDFQNGSMVDCVRTMATDAYMLVMQKNKEIASLKLQLAEKEETVKNLYRQLTIETERKRES